MRKVPLAELVLDFDLYPRADVDSQHVHYMAEAFNAGATLPPLVIDKATKRVVDGFHRVRMYRRVLPEGSKVEVLEKTYKNDAELFLDAMRYNAGHGRTLTTFDRAHCVLLAERFKIKPEQNATALQLTVDAVGKLRIERVGTLRSYGKSSERHIPLKRTIAHMSGQTLTKAQYEANDKLSGMNQLFYVNQLVTLIKNDLLDTENEKLLEGLRVLHELLDGVVATA